MLCDSLSIGSANGAWQLVMEVLREVAGYVLNQQPMRNNSRVPLIVYGFVACGKDMDCAVELLVQDCHCAFGALTAVHHVHVTDERKTLQTGSPACCGWAEGILEPERVPMKLLQCCCKGWNCGKLPCEEEGALS